MARKIEKLNRYIILTVIALISNLKDVNAYSHSSTISPEKSISQVSQTHIIILFIFILLSIILLLFISKILNSSKVSIQEKKNLCNELNDKEIAKIDSNLNKKLLKEQVFSLYKKLETSRTKQNTKNLKEIVTDELYLKQVEETKEIKANKQKIVATNINLENFKVLSIEYINDIQTIKTYLHVSQYDYVIDKNKTVVRGTDESVYQIEYKITLEKTATNQFKIRKKECLGKWIKN